MKKYIIAAVIVCLIIVGAFFGYKYLHDVYFPNKELDDAIQKQQNLYSELKKHDDNILYKCKQINSDTVGWITIPNTNIDYPIVQGSDNDFYLRHGLDKKENSGLGVPFLDYRCSGDFKSFNSIVYAHNMRDEQMFADISLFKSSSFMDSHPTGILTADDGIHDIEFFAYMTVPETSDVYHTVFLNEQEKIDYIDYIYNKAAYVQNITAEELKSSSETLHLILLSTCTYEYYEARGVLVGVIR